MDRLESMRAFVKVVDLAGFAAAARALDLSTTMVSKHVAALEAHLGVPLLTRTTRKVNPTEAGRRFHEHCQAILNALEDAEREVGAQGQAAVGCLRITAPVELGNLHIAPLVSALLRRHPALSAWLDFSNRVVDLVEEGFDAAIRVAPTLDTNLRGRHVTTSRLLLVAAPDYLARHGSPQHPGELAHHATLSFALSMGTVWPFLRDGEQQEIALKPRLVSNSADSLRIAACDGDGIALLPSFLVAADLQAGRLRPVLPSWSHGDLRIFVLHPHRRVQTGRLRAFIDILIERFGEDPDREGFLPQA